MQKKEFYVKIKLSYFNELYKGEKGGIVGKFKQFSSNIFNISIVFDFFAFVQRVQTKNMFNSDWLYLHFCFC